MQLGLAEVSKVSEEFDKKLASASNYDGSALKPQPQSIATGLHNKKTQKTQVIYIGSSHVESAIVTNFGQNKIHNFKTQKIKPLKSSKELFELVYTLVEKNISSLNLNLAVALQPTVDNKDCILAKNSRVHNFNDLVNQPVGQNLNKFLQAKDLPTKVKVNNNLTSLAYLKTSSSESEQIKTIAGIVASGVNFGFFTGKDKFLNLESGKFKFAKKDISESIGEAYLWKNFNQIAKKQKLLINLKNPTEFKKLYQQKSNNKANVLARELVANSAKLVAAKLAAIVKEKQRQNQNLNKFNCLLEGSLFWEFEGYKEVVKTTLLRLGLKSNCIQFKRVKFGFILGSSKLSLTSKAKTTRKIILVLRRFVEKKIRFVELFRGPPQLSFSQ